MDERQVHDLLTSAAESVIPPADLPERAERQYRRRRARSQMLVTVVVVAVVGSGIATAAVIADGRTPAKPVRPTQTTRPRLPRTVDTRTFGSLAFVNATTGYGVATATSGQAVLAKTEDGARTWRALALVPPETGGLALAPRARSLVVWGQPGLYETSDDGAHWHKTLGYNAGNVVASASRIWATVQCAATEGCSNKLMVSRDGGLTWSRATERPTYVGAVATSTKTSSIAFVVELADRRATKWEVAGTKNGTTWTREPTPCADAEFPRLAVGGDGVSLMLVCAADARDHVYVSGNGGREWTETVPLPSEGRVGALSAFDGADSTFVVGKSTTVGPGWDKGPLVYPVLEQWAWKVRPQPVGDVRAFAFAPGAVMYFAASTGVWYQHNALRERRT
jgi:hypothetical protein